MSLRHLVGHHIPIKIHRGADIAVPHMALDGDLPAGAVPDLSVDGTIDLERMASVLFVSRPAFGEEKSTIAVFSRRTERQHPECKWE